MNVRKRWINFIYKTSTGTREVRNLLTPAGVLIFGAFIFLFYLAAIYTDKLLNFPDINLNVWNIVTAALLLIFGLFYGGGVVGQCLKGKGTPVPINPPPELICTGPYMHTRNPMLTGVFSMLFGMGFWMGSLSMILIFTPLFIIGNTLELKKIEEPELEKRLGKQYLEYKKRTPMFVPDFRNMLKVRN